MPDLRETSPWLVSNLPAGGGGETARPAGAFSEDLQARLFGISSQLTSSSRATMLWSEFCWNYSQQRLLGSQSLTLKGWVEWICWRLLVPSKLVILFLSVRPVFISGKFNVRTKEIWYLYTDVLTQIPPTLLPTLCTSQPPLRRNQLIREGRGWQRNEVDYFPASKLSLTLKLSEVINMKCLPIISLHYQANRWWEYSNVSGTKFSLLIYKKMCSR